MSTTTLYEDAARAVRRAMRVHRSTNYVANYFGLPRVIVAEYLYGQNDPGTLYSRKILRVEMARKVKGHDSTWHPTNEDRYKGTRVR